MARKDRRFSLPFSCVYGALYLSICSYPVAASRLNETQVHCLPCSEPYVVSSPIDTYMYQMAVDSRPTYRSGSSSIGLADKVHIPQLVGFYRELKGEGSHRVLASTFKFDRFLGASTDFLDNYHIDVVIVELLPNGVFADPYELQHLVEREVFLDAAVFGDSNLELPSALSNRSIVEIHMHMDYHTLLTSSSLAVELPLHARYPPLDASGYARVEIGMPNVYFGRRHEEPDSGSCSWILNDIRTHNVEIMERTKWDVPCGSEQHAGMVTSITFFTALACAFSIVLATLYLHPSDDVHRDE